MASDFEAALADAMLRSGVPVDTFQYRRSTEAHGLERLLIAISPAVLGLDEPQVIASVYDAMRDRGAALSLAADLWQQAGVLRVVREQPRLSAGGKLPGQSRTQASGL